MKGGWRKKGVKKERKLRKESAKREDGGMTR